MFIKQRRVRKSSKFQSRWSGASRKRREYAASFYTTALVQAFLAFFLFFLSYQSLSMMQEKFPDLVWYLKYAMPFLGVAIGIIAIRAMVGNIAAGIAIYHHHRRPPNP